MPSDWLGSCSGAGTQGGDTTQNNTQSGTQQNDSQQSGSQTTETTGTQSGSATTQNNSTNWTSMIILFGIMIVFVLVMIIPQKRKEKKQKAMLDAIKPGDEIRTIGGIYGKIVSIDGDKAIIESADGTQIEFAKGAISTVESSDVEAEMSDVKTK